MTTQEIIKSKKFKIASIIVGAFLIILVVFAAGIAVGLMKARFSYRFGENYERNFIGPRMMNRGFSGMMGGFEGRNFRNAHGLAGTIISISGNNLIVKDRNGQENTVAVSDTTIIKSGRDTIKITDLKNDEQVSIIGKPSDNGVVNADLIRVFETNNIGGNSNPNNSNNANDANGGNNSSNNGSTATNQ